MAEDSLYDKLLSTATSFLHAMRAATPGSNDASPEALRTHMHPDSQSSFGHKFFISSSPYLSSTKGREQFVTELAQMAAGFKTWTLDITDTCIDVRKRTVVARVELGMLPARGDEVLNDVVFWLEMDESGEKVVRSVEFLDAAATKELLARREGGEDQ